MKLLVDVSTTGPVTSLSEDVCGGLTCRMFEAMSWQLNMFCLLDPDATTSMKPYKDGVTVGGIIMGRTFGDGRNISVPWLHNNRPPDGVYCSMR